MAQREVAAREAQASTQAELSLLQKQIADAESLVGRAVDEARRRRTMQHERSSMLEDLRARANRALDMIYEESVPDGLMC